MGGDEDALDVRRPPFSTFKIPNLLIALDTGAARALDHEIAWDPARRPAAAHWPDDWARDQTLASAFRRSAVWYFQDLAEEVGGPRYRERLAAFAYGNASAPDGSDTFWLDGTLRISVREQVDFLAALLRGDLPVSDHAFDALREAARLGERGEYRLYGKTGAGPVAPGDFDGAFRGWLVGWIEAPDRAPAVYALFVVGPDWRSIARFRREEAERLLAAAGLWPGHGED
nr:penicillin-binding transpeptidase domain-containing protein [Wenzhouxiangella sp. XN79A]